MKIFSVSFFSFALLSLACEGANISPLLVKRGAALGRAIGKVCNPRLSNNCRSGGSSAYRSNSSSFHSSSDGSNRSWSDSDHVTTSGSEDLEASRKPSGARHHLNHWGKGESVEAYDGTRIRDIKLIKPIKDSNAPNDLQKWSGKYIRKGVERKTKLWQQRENGMAQLATGSTPKTRIFDPLNPSSPRSRRDPMSADTKHSNNILKVHTDKDERRENNRERRKNRASSRQR